uniref:Peptidase A1 domain-containing protein n=1 Tax=Strombidium rassoulzadegani TaxID=1082188 RepID=A0A7S3CSQ4_9SPIT|mmetsp:Transcript_7320/g.12374  ORF Transcript_7320/g.12374 Transcript_7320/m.12374 type:complete len:287 (+) Transcript_7320:630-1490(+)
MKASGVIDEMVFSMSIGHGDIQSKITFGGYDIDSYAKDSSEVNWHSIRSGSRHWELGLEGFGFKFEEATYGFSYGSRSKPVIVDSGTSFLLMPKGELLAFLKFIQRKVGIDFKLDVIPMGECTVEQYEQFPDLVMVIDGVQYTVPRESYLGIEMGFQCYMKIMTHDLIPFWILGLNFFENYYTIFDQEQLKVGFAPSIHSKIKEESLLANMIYLDDNFEDIVDNNVKEEQRMRLFMQRTVFGFVCAIGIVTTIVYLRQKQQSKRRRQGQYVQFQGEEATQAPNLMI